MKLTCILYTFRFFWDINIMIMHCFAMLQTVRYLFDICKYVHKLLFNCVICELYQKQLQTKYNNFYSLYISINIIYVILSCHNIDQCLLSSLWFSTLCACQLVYYYYPTLSIIPQPLLSLRHGWKYAPAFPKRTPQKFYQLHVQIIVLAVGGLIKDESKKKKWQA